MTQRLIVKIINLDTRRNLDKLYNNHKWYQLVKKNKWDEVAFPTSPQCIIYKMNPLSRKYFLHSHKIY